MTSPKAELIKLYLYMKRILNVIKEDVKETKIDQVMAGLLVIDRSLCEL